MITTQERILDQLSKALAARSVSHSISHSFSNNGSVYLYRSADDTAAFGSIYFYFDSSDYKLRIKINGREIPSQIGRDGYSDFYQPYDKETRFWDVLCDELDKAGFPIKTVPKKKERVAAPA
jgi:hypothetical protein